MSARTLQSGGPGAQAGAGALSPRARRTEQPQRRKPATAHRRADGHAAGGRLAPRPRGAVSALSAPLPGMVSGCGAETAGSKFGGCSSRTHARTHAGPEFQ